MEIIYQAIESSVRGYHGGALGEEDCRRILLGPVKRNLLDQEQRDSLTEAIQALREETGFSPQNLLVDIQTLDDDTVNVPDWRIGEAMAEVVLEENFQCRFHWNELRDARNPRGNKTGADLVGFIEVDGQVLFLFGEAKTSSETDRRPPQVMTKADGVENQLRALYTDHLKRFILIGYLQNKARLHPDGHQFKEDFNNAIYSYYYGERPFQIFGVLVRDVDHDERDVSLSYTRLKDQILLPIGIQLFALYVPVDSENWLELMNNVE